MNEVLLKNGGSEYVRASSSKAIFFIVSRTLVESSERVGTRDDSGLSAERFCIFHFSSNKNFCCLTEFYSSSTQNGPMKNTSQTSWRSLDSHSGLIAQRGIHPCPVWGYPFLQGTLILNFRDLYMS